MHRTLTSSSVRKLLGADLRSLALLRVALGAILLVDLGLRATDLVAHYTDAGVLPRADLIALAEEPHWFSVHMGSGRPEFQAVLFVLAGLAALALALGWRTRAAAALSWFMLCSLQARNPMVLNSGDVLLRVLLFWGIFLPWGATLSLDARHRAPREACACDAGTLAYALQIVCLYLTAGLHKSGQAWRDGTAVYYALSIDQFATRLGERMLDHPGLMTFLTYATVVFQLSVPVLLFFPWKTGFFRTVAVAGTVLLHLGIAACMHLGIFSAVATVAALGLLPGAVWDRLGWRAKAGEHPVPRVPLLVQACVALLALASLAWNLHNLWTRVPTATFVPRLLRLDQHWGMFAPQPMADDGWYVTVGELANGREVDLRSGQDVHRDKPPHVSETYPNERWRKYMMNLCENRCAPHRPLYAAYLARVWNAEHRGPWQTRVVTLWFMRERTGDDKVEPLRLLRWEVPEKTEPNGFEQLFGPYRP